VNEQRTPTESRPPRMDALARLPVFYALEGKRVLVAGGNAAAAWKAELLSAAGALVDVLCEAPGEEMISLAQDPPRGAIALHARHWSAADLKDCAIAIGACDTEDEAAQFAAAARAAGVPVNVIDKPAFCDFSFGSIVNRSPMVIGISTDGAAPVFAQAIRAKLEAFLPRGFGQWALAARRWRRNVKASGLTFEGRRRFWQHFTGFALRHPDMEPAQENYESFLETTRAEGKAVNAGCVTLVGAGPGDPELLTLRAVRALQSADIILIDDLVSPEILDFARREAKKMLVGKTGHGPSCTQDDINTLMVGLAKSGKRVVRLKGGDPMIFGRAGEEIAACRAAKIPLEVVPGITAAQGAASRLAVSLSHRNLARRIQYITGHSEKGMLPDDIDWKSLADPHATTAVYMPARTLSDLVAHGLKAGLDRTTPALAIINATRPSEIVVSAPIADLPQRLAAQAIDGPVLVMIGHVLAENAMTASVASQDGKDGGKDGSKDGGKRTKRK
jgi:uroporphyrin-III C-methyltransferase/precorrin-2 dehydrogenase/sirohydrochlorin ferrochelatase